MAKRKNSVNIHDLAGIGAAALLEALGMKLDMGAPSNVAALDKMEQAMCDAQKTKATEFQPCIKNFGNIVVYMAHPRKVELNQVGLGSAHTITVYRQPSEVARELREIAEWLDTWLDA